MSGTGPVEPGEGTHAWDGDAWHGTGDPGAAPPPRSRGRLAEAYTRHRRAVIAAASAVALALTGGYVYATRPQDPPPPVTPMPSQVVTVAYLGERQTPAGTLEGAFSFAVELTVDAGPPVTVQRIVQPSAALALSTEPRTPFRTRVGHPHRITVTAYVTDCTSAPRSARLPFIDVTLRNTRAIQSHSFILGERYAQDLSKAIEVACGNEQAS
ncbi:Tat pathway signal sequence domain protein [Streptomyces sp. GC420]|uniref:Tat pathway signal sequence domain protein n=1 Tax=Streptomyces sp. GC420 TaxID=2697568 RepID=UPI00141510FD|nr:Tat pathway signal sequence domain protein [Streptomyces sp. GC420]NBM16816.1 Tat pathway signal sequence domain protein [Streptomyces sp. GC420]